MEKLYILSPADTFSFISLTHSSSLEAYIITHSINKNSPSPEVKSTSFRTSKRKTTMVIPKSWNTAIILMISIGRVYKTSLHKVFGSSLIKHLLYLRVFYDTLKPLLWVPYIPSQRCIWFTFPNKKRQKYEDIKVDKITFKTKGRFHITKWIT